MLVLILVGRQSAIEDRDRIAEVLEGADGIYYRWYGG